MGKLIAVFVCVFALFVATSASACNVAVQSFGVQSFCAPQVQSFAVQQQYAVQQFAVPVQTYAVQAFATPVCAQQVFVQNVGHHHRQRVFARQQSTQVIRSRTVIRSR